MEAKWTVSSAADPHAVKAAVHGLGGDWEDGDGVVAADVALARVAAGVRLAVYMVRPRDGRSATVTICSEAHTGCAPHLAVGAAVATGLAVTGHWMLAVPALILVPIGTGMASTRMARPTEVRRQFQEARAAVARVCPLDGP